MNSLEQAASHSVGVALIFLSLVLTARLFAMENNATGYRDSYRVAYVYYTIVGMLGVFCWLLAP